MAGFVPRRASEVRAERKSSIERHLLRYRPNAVRPSLLVRALFAPRAIRASTQLVSELGLWMVTPLSTACAATISGVCSEASRPLTSAPPARGLSARAACRLYAAWCSAPATSRLAPAEMSRSISVKSDGVCPDCLTQLGVEAGRLGLRRWLRLCRHLRPERHTHRLLVAARLLQPHALGQPQPALIHIIIAPTWRGDLCEVVAHKRAAVRLDVLEPLRRARSTLFCGRLLEATKRRVQPGAAVGNVGGDGPTVDQTGKSEEVPHRSRGDAGAAIRPESRLELKVADVQEGAGVESPFARLAVKHARIVLERAIARVSFLVEEHSADVDELLRLGVARR